jgi:hypothetical protein
MGEDIEQHLVTAARTLRECEVTALRCGELVARMDELTRQLAERRAVSANEQRDVERLEGLSLTRLVASLRGARHDSLARERAEAAAAGYQVSEVTARLKATRSEHAAARAHLDRLAEAPARYAAALDEWERHLRDSGDPRSARLGELATERGQLTGELHELTEAVAAARRADSALVLVEEKLGSASDWSTFDTFLRGGAIVSSMKHSRLDEAAQLAAQADQRLAVLRTELADVSGKPPSAPHLAISGSTRFVDIWFDNIFTDIAVGERIKAAQHSVAESRRRVGDVQARLQQRMAGARRRLDEIDAERRALLEPGS